MKWRHISSETFSGTAAGTFSRQPGCGTACATHAERSSGSVDRVVGGSRMVIRMAASSLIHSPE